VKVELELFLHSQTGSGRATFSLIALVQNNIRASVGLGVRQNGKILEFTMQLLREKLAAKMNVAESQLEFSEVKISERVQHELDKRIVETFNKLTESN
jgi:hypothetical protein